MSSLPDKGATVPVVNLGPPEISAEHLFEAWYQAVSPLFDVVPIQDPRSYYCSATSYLVDQLMFNHTAFDGMQFIRPSQKLAGSESDCITLQYYGTGSMQGSLGNGTPLVMEPNRISIQDFAHAYSGLGATTNNFGVIIPRHLIKVQDEIYKNHPMFSWEITSPQGRLLISALNSLWQDLPYMTQADAPAAAAGFVGLLNGLLTAKWNEATRQQVQQASLKAMQDYLQNNLGQPNLGVEQLCQTFHCSRASVYRLFKPLGGVKRYIQSQRLMAVFRELQNLSPDSTQKISDVAARWGFTNMTHFYHLFKQQFEMTPSEARDVVVLASTTSTKAISSQSEEVEQLRQWLERY